MTFVIRKAVFEDFARIAQYLEILVMGMSDPDAKGQNAYSLKKLLSVYPESLFDAFVAECTIREEPEIVGIYVVTYRRTSPDRRIVDGCSVYVRPERRGQGIGKALLKAVVQDLVAKGYVAMFFFMGGKNDASRLLHLPLQPETMTCEEGLRCLQIALSINKLTSANNYLSKEIEIDFAKEDDYNDVIRLIHQMNKKVMNLINLEDPEFWKRSLSGNKECFYTIVARLQNGNKIVGCATFVLSYCIHYRNVLILDRIVVDREYRRKGIGRTLVAASVQAAMKTVNVDVIRTAVQSQDREVMTFFRRLGAIDKSEERHWLWMRVGQQQMKSFAL